MTRFCRVRGGVALAAAHGVPSSSTTFTSNSANSNSASASASASASGSEEGTNKSSLRVFSSLTLSALKPTWGSTDVLSPLGEVFNPFRSPKEHDQKAFVAPPQQVPAVRLGAGSGLVPSPKGRYVNLKTGRTMFAAQMPKQGVPPKGRAPPRLESLPVMGDCAQLEFASAETRTAIRKQVHESLQGKTQMNAAIAAVFLSVRDESKFKIINFLTLAAQGLMETQGKVREEKMKTIVNNVVDAFLQIVQARVKKPQDAASLELVGIKKIGNTRKHEMQHNIANILVGINALEVFNAGEQSGSDDEPTVSDDVKELAGTHQSINVLASRAVQLMGFLDGITNKTAYKDGTAKVATGGSLFVEQVYKPLQTAAKAAMVSLRSRLNFAEELFGMSDTTTRLLSELKKRIDAIAQSDNAVNTLIQKNLEGQAKNKHHKYDIHQIKKACTKLVSNTALYDNFQKQLIYKPIKSKNPNSDEKKVSFSTRWPEASGEHSVYIYKAPQRAYAVLAKLFANRNQDNPTQMLKRMAVDCDKENVELRKAELQSCLSAFFKTYRDKLIEAAKDHPFARAHLIHQIWLMKNHLCTTMAMPDDSAGCLVGETSLETAVVSTGMGLEQMAHAVGGRTNAPNDLTDYVAGVKGYMPQLAVPPGSPTCVTNILRALMLQHPQVVSRYITRYYPETNQPQQPRPAYSQALANLAHGQFALPDAKKLTYTQYMDIVSLVSLVFEDLCNTTAKTNVVLSMPWPYMQEQINDQNGAALPALTTETLPLKIAFLKSHKAKSLETFGGDGSDNVSLDESDVEVKTSDQLDKSALGLMLGYHVHNYLSKARPTKELLSEWTSDYDAGRDSRGIFEFITKSKTTP